MAKTIAVVSEPTQALSHSGCGCLLPAGEYEYVDIDGADGVRYLHGPDSGDLICVAYPDPNINYREED